MSKFFRRAIRTLMIVGAATITYAFTFTLNSLTGLPRKWPAGTIPITIKLGNTTTLADGKNFNTSAEAAALTWNGILGSVQFQATLATAGSAGNRNGTNEMSFAANVYGQDFGENTLAVTTGWSRGNERTEDDILFNVSVKWDSYRGARPAGVPVGTVDLQRVALHEMGHMLGLDHPDKTTPAQSVSAIMNSLIGNLDTLTSDDIQGAQSLYGPPGTPANDNFADAAEIILNNVDTITLQAYNTNATKESGEPSHAGYPGGRSVWWKWTAPSSGSVTVDTIGSYFDTTLGVYTGSALASLTNIASDDDIEDGVIQASTVTFNVTGSTLYRIAIDGFNNIGQDPTDKSGADNGGISLKLKFTSAAGSLPVITTQPLGATVNTGQTVSFSVVATGTDPLTYQWYFGGNAISGATAATYSQTNITSTRAGTYRVVVSNPAGTTTSNDATLTVNPPPAPTPAPAPSRGGGGGGGAPSWWFVLILSGLSLVRAIRFRR